MYSKKFSIKIFLIVVFSWLFLSCQNNFSGNEQMISLLSSINVSEQVFKNPFASKAVLAHYDSMLQDAPQNARTKASQLIRGIALLNVGDEQKAVYQLEDLANSLPAGMSEAKLITMQSLRLQRKRRCLKTSQRTPTYRLLKGIVLFQRRN